MAARFWALRCCRCRLFQVQQARRSGRWSCGVCGQRQAVHKVYGQGSGQECRHHVQKLNLLQGEAEEAIVWTSRLWRCPSCRLTSSAEVHPQRQNILHFELLLPNIQESHCESVECVEDSVSGSKSVSSQHEGGSFQQEERAEVSRWSKYLDKDSEDEGCGEDQAGTERPQLCSQRKNAVEQKRKWQTSFLSSDVEEYEEENGVFQVAYQAKKQKKCLVHDAGDGDALSGDTMVPAVCESVVPEKNTQTPTAHTKPSKWEKFLSCSENYSENAARVTLSPQEGSGRLELHSTTAADTGRASGCSEQAGRTPPAQFKCVASTEQLASKLSGTMVPSPSCPVEEMLVKEHPSHWIRAGAGVVEATAGRCCLGSPGRVNTHVLSNTGPQPSTTSLHLFCTGDEFDDDL